MKNNANDINKNESIIAFNRGFLTAKKVYQTKYYSLLYKIPIIYFIISLCVEAFSKTIGSWSYLIGTMLCIFIKFVIDYSYDIFLNNLIENRKPTDE